MNKEENIVYSEEVLSFMNTASRFVEFIEYSDGIKLRDYIDQADKILPELYFRIIYLPLLTPEFEELNQRFVSEEDYEYYRNKLLMKFGEYDTYEEVFDTNRLEGEDSIGESIAENLTDIYQDIKDFVLLYQIGTNEVMYEAVWELRQSFEEFWGQKLVNTLRAIHKLRFGSDEIEESPINKRENINFNSPDTSNWFISRRQEDIRDEE